MIERDFKTLQEAIDQLILEGKNPRKELGMQRTFFKKIQVNKNHKILNKTRCKLFDLYGITIGGVKPQKVVTGKFYYYDVEHSELEKFKKHLEKINGHWHLDSKALKIINKLLDKVKK